MHKTHGAGYLPALKIYPNTKGAVKMANKANRNAQGTGTIRQRSDGRWEARYTVGRNSGTGKQIQKSIYGKTQAEVRKKLQAVEVDINNGNYTEPSKLTVSEWLDIWLDKYTNDIKPYTKASYKGQCENHLKPNVGAVKLDALSTHTIQKLYNRLYKGDETGSPLSAKTIKNIHGVLHKALNQAVKIGYLRFNPADNCSLPKIIKKEMSPLTDTDIKAFLTACGDNAFETLYYYYVIHGYATG